MFNLLVFMESFNAIALLLIILTITQCLAMGYMITTKITKVFAMSSDGLCRSIC